MRYMRNMRNIWKDTELARPELYPHKKVIGFDDAMLARIEDWRRKQTPIPSVSEAIRALLDAALLDRGIA
jgi:hypothetical protein